MTVTREDLSGLKLARSIIEENWPADALLEIVDNCIAEAQSAEPVQGEAVEVVGFVTLGGVFHGGSGPELGEIDIEPDMGVLERLQYKTVTGSDDVYLDLMTVAQFNRIMAAAKPDAELVELLRLAKAALDPFDDKLLEARIDAKLAEANKP